MGCWANEEKESVNADKNSDKNFSLKYRKQLNLTPKDIVMKSFASDNYAGVLPEVMEALEKVNKDHARSYGADETTRRVIALFREVFEADVDVYFVFMNGCCCCVFTHVTLFLQC